MRVWVQLCGVENAMIYLHGKTFCMAIWQASNLVNPLALLHHTQHQFDGREFGQPVDGIKG